MSYKSYFTQKNKLNSAELATNIQANDISLQQWIESKTVTKFKNSSPRNLMLTNTVQWNSPWIDMDSRLDVYGTLIEVWKNWTIPIGEISQDWIYNFKVEIICRNGVDGDGDSSGFQISQGYYFRKFIGWDIKDIVGSETSIIKSLKLNASVYSYKPFLLLPLPLFQTQLLVKYINQANHD